MMFMVSIGDLGGFRADSNLRGAEFPRQREIPEYIDMGFVTVLNSTAWTGCMSIRRVSLPRSYIFLAQILVKIS